MQWEPCTLTNLIVAHLLALLLSDSLLGNSRLYSSLLSTVQLKWQLNCWLCHCRPVSREAVQQLETALALARYASRDVRDTTQAAAANAAAEVAARDALHDAMSAKSGTGVAAEAIEVLDFAVQRALPFPRLQVRHS